MSGERKIAWGGVLREVNNKWQILVAERATKSDPLRKGEFVYPGGEKRLLESHQRTAERCVLEETGIKAKAEQSSNIFQGYEFKVRNSKIRATVEANGKIHIKYPDSGNKYVGKLVRLAPLDANQEPTAQPNTEANNPMYVPMKSLPQLKEMFTPACQILTTILEDYHLKALL